MDVCFITNLYQNCNSKKTNGIPPIKNPMGRGFFVCLTYSIYIHIIIFGPQCKIWAMGYPWAPNNRNLTPLVFCNNQQTIFC